VGADLAIDARRLVKRYGHVCAVDGLDLGVRAGEIYGFIGRNGAGKTTTIRMLLGLIRPTAGEVHLLGRRVRRGRQDFLSKVGSLVETATAYANLTARENLELHRRLTGAPARSVAEAIALLRLDEYADRPAGTLSLGNRQRLSLARALLHRPELLVLDEPTNALDPAGIVEIRTLLRELAEERGVTVFVSSHILAEVAQLVHRIGIVHAGTLVEELTVDELRRKTAPPVEIDTSDPTRAASLLAARFGASRVQRTEANRIAVHDAADRTAEMARLLVSGGIDLTRLATEPEDLESYFLRRTAGGSR
jgi:ABC-2 type transport system ATP-binding protein